MLRIDVGGLRNDLCLEGRELALTYPELARLAVETAAPEELELLPDATAAWYDGKGRGGRPGRWTGGAVEFGLDSALLVEVVFPLLTGTMAEVLGERVTARWFARKRRRAPQVPALTLEQAQRVRQECLTQALNAGLKPHRAALVADAVSGALLLQAADER
jgi:hypothetical protein